MKKREGGMKEEAEESGRKRRRREEGRKRERLGEGRSGRSARSLDRLSG